MCTLCMCIILLLRIIIILFFSFLQRLGGPNEDSNMSADINVPGTPESQSNMSQKSIEAPSNNNESILESHTPPLPTEKSESPPPAKKRKSRFEDAPPNESDKTRNIKMSERLKQEEKQTSKKSNEWDMFAEADNIGDFNVCILMHIYSNFLDCFNSLYGFVFYIGIVIFLEPHT